MKNLRKICSLLALSLGVSSWPALAGDWIYHTERDDTLWDICLKYTNKRGCWMELPKYNGISNDRAIPVGTKIRIPQDWLLQPVQVGNVRSFRGEVTVEHAGASQPAVLNLPLYLGDRVVVADGSAVLQLGAASEVLVRENTEVNLVSLSGVADAKDSGELDVPKGSVEISVEPGRGSSFEVTTPAAIAAVRGTRYRVSSGVGDGDQTRVEVLSGAVEMASADTDVLQAGQGGLASKGSGNVVKELLPAPSFDQASYAGEMPLTISWNAPAGVGQWQVDVFSVDATRGLVRSERLQQPQIKLSELEPGCYNVVVSAIDSDGFQGMDESTEACLSPATGFDTWGAVIFIGTLLALILI